MNITEQQIEAGARALAGRISFYEWDDLSQASREPWRRDARAVLTAAAEAQRAEPVAYALYRKTDGALYDAVLYDEAWNPKTLSAVPLYAHPETPNPSVQVMRLIRDLTDPGECWFDHHGGCQEHGYLVLEPGEKCPHAEAKELLSAWEPVENTEEGRDA